jgi:hypothetical protein
LTIRKVVRMAEDRDIGVQVLQSMFSMGGRHCRLSVSSANSPWGDIHTGERLSDFLIDNHINANTALSRSLQHPVQPVLFILRRGSAEV